MTALLTRKSLDAQGGAAPALPADALAEADFVTLPDDVPGTNCSNCLYAKAGTCAHEKLLGQPVNDRNCCFLPGNLVSGDFLAASQAVYAGEAVEIRTAAGHRLRVTVNHPILTKHGLVPAGAIQQGDYLIRHRHDVVGGTAAQDYVEYTPTSVEEVFGSLSASGFVVEAAGPLDFHGDGGGFQGGVNVVRTDRFLGDELDTAFLEFDGEGVFAYSRLTQSLLPLDRQLGAGGRGASLPDGLSVAAGKGPYPAGGLGGPLVRSKTRPVLRDHLSHPFRVEAPRFGGHTSPLQNQSLPLGTQPDFRLGKKFLNGVGTPSGHARQFGNGRTIVVRPDEVIDVKRSHYFGPVYDFQTATGLIIADSLLVSNCSYWDNPGALRAWLAREKSYWVYDKAALRALVEKVPGPHQFATTMFDLPHNAASVCQQMAMRVAEDDLGPGGREPHSHVTVLYGLDDGQFEQVAALVRGFGPVAVNLGTTGLFHPGVGGPDVLKVDVHSAGLLRLHDLLDKLPNAGRFPVYRPHVTLAYLKPGRGERYAGMNDARGLKLTMEKLVFSTPAGRRAVIHLASGASSGGVGRTTPTGTCRPGERSDLTGCVPASHLGRGPGGPRASAAYLKALAKEACRRGQTQEETDCTPAREGESASGGESARLEARVWQQGGFTYEPTKRHTPTRGVVVSLPREEGWEKPLSDEEFHARGGEELRGYLRNVREAIRSGRLKDGLAHVGAWHDTKTGRVVLDVNEVYPDEATAAKVGRERSQDAVYDIGAGREIDLRGPGGERPQGDVGKDHGRHDGRGVGRAGGRVARAFSAPGGAVGKSLPRNVLKAAGPCRPGQRSDLTGCTPAEGDAPGGDGPKPQRPRTGSRRGVTAPPPVRGGAGSEPPGVAPGHVFNPDEDVLPETAPARTPDGPHRPSLSVRAAALAVRALARLSSAAASVSTSNRLFGAEVEVMADDVKRQALSVGGAVEFLKSHVERYSEKAREAALEVAHENGWSATTVPVVASALGVLDAGGALAAASTLVRAAHHDPAVAEIAHLGAEVVQVIPFGALGYLAYSAAARPVKTFNAVKRVAQGSHGHHGG